MGAAKRAPAAERRRMLVEAGLVAPEAAIGHLAAAFAPLLSAEEEG